MKKAITAVLVLVFALTVFISANGSEYELQTKPDGIVIDGVMSDGEWDSAVKISLDKENTGMWANFYDENSRLPLFAYFYYGDEGIYAAADIYDNDVDTENMHDCFELAFNPGGLIPDGDSLEGLFFTFWLDGDKIVMKRHNRFEGDQGGDFEKDAVCRYAMTDHGYTAETLIKWEWLTLPDRPVLDAKAGKYKTGVLSGFDPSAEGAFTYAIVCYLNGNGGDRSPYRCVYRTVTDPALAGNFSTATYDIKFTFAKAEVTVTESETEPATETVRTDDTEQTAEPVTTGTEQVSAGGGAAKIIIPVLICAAAAAAAAVTVIIVKRRRSK